MNTDKNKKLLGLKNAPKYNPSKRRWYTKDGHMVQPGKAYYVKRQNRYVQYNTDGTITELPTANVVYRRIVDNHLLRDKLSRGIYSIPYKTPIKLTQKGDRSDSKKSRLDRGALVNPNLVDSILKYGNLEGLKKLEALGLAAQESTFGNGYEGLLIRLQNKDSIPSHLIFSNHKYVQSAPQESYLYKNRIIGLDTTGRVIANERRLNDGLANWEKEWQEYIKHLPQSPVQEAFKYYKTGMYNSNDPDYYNKVRSRGSYLQNSPELMQMIQNSPYNYDDSNYKWTTFKEGGKLNRQEIVNNFFKRRANKFAGDETSSMRRVEQPAVDMYGNPVPLRLHQEYLPGIEGVNPYTNQTSPNVYVDNKGRTISPDVIRGYNYMRQVPTVDGYGNIDTSYEGIQGSQTYLPEVSVTGQRNYAKDNAEWNAAHPNHIQKGALDVALKQALPKYEVNPYFDIGAGLDEGLRDPKMYKDLGAVLAAPYLAGAQVPASANLGFQYMPKLTSFMTRAGNFLLGSAKLNVANHIIDYTPVWLGRALGDPAPEPTWDAIPKLITDNEVAQNVLGVAGQLAQDIYLLSRRGNWGKLFGANNFDKVTKGWKFLKPGTKWYGFLNPRNYSIKAGALKKAAALGIMLKTPGPIDAANENGALDDIYYNSDNLMAPDQMTAEELEIYRQQLETLSPRLRDVYERRPDVKKAVQQYIDSGVYTPDI